MKIINPRNRLSTCSLLLTSLFCQLAPSRAATLTVTTTNDGGAGSLRQAIADAAAGDSIIFSFTGVITLTNGELLVTNDLTILGPGATNLSVSGNSQTRVLEIGSNITANISGLTIRDGHGAGAAH